MKPSEEIIKDVEVPSFSSLTKPGPHASGCCASQRKTRFMSLSLGWEESHLYALTEVNHPGLMFRAEHE